MCQRAAWPGQILLYNGGVDVGREGERGEREGERKGAGEEMANVLLMGFIQACRLQARPPHGRVGVIPPPPFRKPPLPQLLLSFPSKVEQESASAAVSGPHSSYLTDKQTTVL